MDMRPAAAERGAGMTAGGGATRRDSIDADTVSPLVRAVLSAIRNDANVWGRLRELLTVTGAHIPVSVALERLVAMLEGGVECTAVELLQIDEERYARIRQFFLRPEPTYSLPELAELWSAQHDDLQEIFYDCITGTESARPFSLEDARIEWADAVRTAVTYSLLRPFDVECALGDKFSLARSERWRTVPVVVRLPRFVAAAFVLAPAVPATLAIACKIEQLALEFFTTEDLAGTSVGVPG